MLNLIQKRIEAERNGNKDEKSVVQINEQSCSLRVCSLVVSNLCSETKNSRFEFGC